MDIIGGSTVLPVKFCSQCVFLLSSSMMRGLVPLSAGGPGLMEVECFLTSIQYATNTPSSTPTTNMTTHAPDSAIAMVNVAILLNVAASVTTPLVLVVVVVANIVASSVASLSSSMVACSSSVVDGMAVVASSE